MKKSIKVEGVEYRRDNYGVLIPEALFVREGGRCTKPEDFAGYLAAERAAEQEHFIVITLDGANQVIKKHTVTIGLVNQSQIAPRECFRQAILDNAVSIVIAHNHPSGSLEASANDLLATRRLSEAGAILKIPVLDHIIVSRDGMLSLREHFPNYFTGGR
jgi:DNA repair protein RadC